jgi:hypothetical protein
LRSAATPFETWKERALCALVAACLGGYVASRLLLAGASTAEPGPAPSEQRYVRSFEPGELPESAGDVFPTEDPWDDSLPRVWVQPKEAPKVEIVKVSLDPPLPAIPSPPTLLPVPAPALEFTTGLPRWPEAPRGP